MQASQTLIDFLKLHEGFRANPYLDTEGVPTIGYGSTFYEDNRRVTMADSPISEPVASQMLLSTLDVDAVYLQKLTRGVSLNQNQVDALLEFEYNLGSGSLASSTLLKLILADITNPHISEQFGRWVHGQNGAVLSALVERRAWDKAMWDGTLNQSA